MMSVRRASKTRIVSALLVTALAMGGVATIAVATGAIAPQASAAAPGPSASQLSVRASATPIAVELGSAERSTVIDQVSRAGVFGPELGIAVANLTVTPGQYYVGYSYESRVDSAYAPGTLRCGLVDSNGVNHFIANDPQEVTSGTGWRSHRAVTTFNLGDVTLGIRCDPETIGLYRASFRDVDFWVVRMPFDR